MSGPRAARISCMVALLAALPAPCLADSIFLNAAGQSNLGPLRARMGPAAVFDDPIRKMPFIRGVIVGERAGRDPQAPYKTLEGSPEYDVVAFDATGNRRSDVFTISDAWIDHILPDFDSELDIRAAFSNRDERAGVALGSRAYFAMVRRAIDPQGTLGLWRADAAVPPEPAGVEEGTVVRFLRDPPIGEGSLEAGWSARQRASTMARLKDALARRLPTAHLRTWEGPPSGLVGPLVGSIARERAYRLSRTGFERAALGMLVFILDLAGAQPDSAHARAIAAEGRQAIEHLLVPIMSAGPHGDEVQCAWEASFCTDWTERLAVSLDALIASDGLFYSTHWTAPAAQGLIELQSPLTGGPLPAGRVDVRPGAMRLLVHMLKPPKGRDAAGDEARRAFASQARERLYRLLLDNGPLEYHATVRRALSAGGWGSAEELLGLVNGLLQAGQSYAGDAHRAGADAERRRWMRELATMRIANLRGLAELGGSALPHERAAAARILERVEEMRRTVQAQETDGSERVFLEIWNGLPASPSR